MTMRRGLAEITATSAVAAAAIEGGRYSPRDPQTAAWYARLRKPSFTPPGPLIGIVWMGLDALLCYTGTRLLAAPNSCARTVALTAWATDVAGLAVYPWVSFGRRRLDLGAAASATMFAAAATTSLAGRRVDRDAARANLPLVAWLGLASTLAVLLWRRNR